MLLRFTDPALYRRYLIPRRNIMSTGDVADHDYGESQDRTSVFRVSTKSDFVVGHRYVGMNATAYN